MNKSELTRVLYTLINKNVSGGYITLNGAASVLEDLVDTVFASVKDGGEVRLPKLGKLYTTQCAGRTIPHPHIEGQALQVPPFKQIQFKAFDSAKKVLNSRD
jgi:nucleoid DNA-binding protein